MKNTGFFVPENKINRFAQNYRFDENNNTLIPFEKSHLGEYYGEDVAFESGGAGLVSTIDDYSHFSMMMINNGEYKGKKILERKTIDFMLTDKLNKEQKAEFKKFYLFTYKIRRGLLKLPLILYFIIYLVFPINLISLRFHM